MTWKHRWPRLERLEVIHAVRTTIAAVTALLLARLLKLPEFYWAPITTIIVTQSTLGAALNISKQRLLGTALGAVMAALLVTYAGGNTVVYGAGILFCGLICALFHVERSAFRYAGITLTIVMLTAHQQPPWIIAVHRFVEISLGIVVGLLISAVWPESQTATLSGS